MSSKETTLGIWSLESEADDIAEKGQEARSETILMQSLSITVFFAHSTYHSSGSAAWGLNSCSEDRPKSIGGGNPAIAAENDIGEDDDHPVSPRLSSVVIVGSLPVSSGTATTIATCLSTNRDSQEISSNLPRDGLWMEKHKFSSGRKSYWEQERDKSSC